MIKVMLSVKSSMLSVYLSGSGQIPEEK